MKNRTFRRSLLISGSLLVAVVGIILACTGGDDFEDYYNSFFAPEVSHESQFVPFFRSQNKFYGDRGYNETTPLDYTTTNIAEWSQLFRESVSASDLEYIVYKSRIGEIDTLIFYLKNGSYPIKPYLKRNTLLTFPDANVIREALFYLGFAKRCQPFATYAPDYWDSDRSNDPRKDKQAMQKLIDGGTRAFSNARNNLIKQRYFFQLVRLLYQAGQYNECVAFYNQNSAVFTSNNSMKYRAMGYLAGAYYKLEDYSHANYLYAIIYDEFPEMRTIAWLSFHPQDEEDWNASLQLAKTDHEKEVLWQMLGIYADPLRAMKEIYALNPKSNLLDVLLTRAVNMEEENFIPNVYWGTDDSTYSLKPGNVGDELVAFTESVADNQNTEKPYLWNLAAGYLDVVKGDYKKGDAYLQKALSKASGDQLVLEQTRLIRIISKIELFAGGTKKFEDDMAGELTWLSKAKHDAALRSGSMYDWALKRLSFKYASIGDLVKAQCLNYQRDKNFYDDTLKVKAMVAYMDKPNKSAFDKFILGVHPYSRNDLFEYQAINLYYQGKPDEALSKLDASKGSGDEQLPADPFLIHINDCHDCDFEASQDETYTKYSLLKRIIELEAKTKTDTKNASQYYFLLGNAYYNTTYFGNNRAFYETDIKTTGVMWEFSSSFGNFSDPIYDCSKAEEYYKKAMNFSTDMEFKAKCCFMAAKCEQNRYYISDDFAYDKVVYPGENYKLLRFKYQKTKYYQEIIKECGYFRTYLGMK